MRFNVYICSRGIFSYKVNISWGYSYEVLCLYLFATNFYTREVWSIMVNQLEIKA